MSEGEVGMTTNGVTGTFVISMGTSFGAGLREGLVAEPRSPLKLIRGDGRGSKKKRPQLRVIEGGRR
jgi:hypothetical protein